MCTDHPKPNMGNPQEGYTRQIFSSPIGRIGTGAPNSEMAQLKLLDESTVMMMGDNPALPQMPERPTLIDFFKYRFEGITRRHLLGSAKRALDAGQEEKIVIACLLHDISNGCFIRADHGYWGAQMIAPYVNEEVAWAVQYHQALRYVADPDVGYVYPESYHHFFGKRYQIPQYILDDAAYARQHKWYMTARLVTLNDLYFFDDTTEIDPEDLTDVIGRNFRQPEEGLGFDRSPTAHMWRTMIWPNNFL